MNPGNGHGVFADETDEGLAHWLSMSTIVAAASPLPTYTDQDFADEEARKTAIRREFLRRGYSEDEVARIERNDWTPLDGRGDPQR
jgi:hypothetical protein